MSEKDSAVLRNIFIGVATTAVITISGALLNTYIDVQLLKNSENELSVIAKENKEVMHQIEVDQKIQGENIRILSDVIKRVGGR